MEIIDKQAWDEGAHAKIESEQHHRHVYRTVYR